jgi:hypothetical protein
MAEEMIEDVAWESDEAEDWESDEAIAEAEDSAEDIGERARRRRRPRRSFRPGRGVQGIAVRGQDGRVRNVPFPTKLATAAETNRGLANQEIARRALDARLDRLEARFRVQQKNDSAASGLVSLVIGGGLTAYAAIQAARQPGGSILGNWASEGTTRLATLVSVSQIATSGAKLVINGQYHRSGIGIAADIFAAAQVAAFAFGSLYKPEAISSKEPDLATANKNIANHPVGSLVLAEDTGQIFQVVTLASGAAALQLIK